MTRWGPGASLTPEELSAATAELGAIPVAYDFALSQHRLPGSLFESMTTAWRAFRSGVAAFVASCEDDLGRMAESLRLPGRLIPVWESLPPHEWALIARPDMIISGGRPLIVDVNAHSLAGHFPLNDLTLRAHRGPALRSLFAGPGTPRFVMGHYADILRRFLTDDRDLVALSYFADEDVGENNPNTWHYRAEIHELRRLGLDARTVRVEELDISAHGVYADGRKIGLIQRFFNAHLNEKQMPELARLASAAREGAVNVLTGLRGEILNTKATIAVLSSDEFTDGLPPSLAARLGQALPWSRLMRECHTRWRDKRIDLPGWTERNRTRLVLKPAFGSLGRSVTIGREKSEREWSVILNGALSDEEPWIVQELIVPDHHEVRFFDKAGELRTETGPAVHGAYILDGELAGGICRHGRQGDQGLMINGLTGAIPAPVYWL